MIDRRKWLAAVNGAQLPQSAKRYAGWLITRPVKGTQDEYKAGQAAAAKALGLSIRTTHTAESTLVERGWMRRARRGTRRSNYSTFVILDASHNVQKLHVVDGLQHEDGGRLYDFPQHAVSSASMTSEPLRGIRNHRSTFGTRRALRAARAGSQRRSDGQDGSNFLVAATSRNMTSLERTVIA